MDRLELDTFVTDWDGVIMDSFPAVIQTYVPLFRELTGRELDTEWFARVYSADPKKNLETLGIPLSDLPRAMEIFFEHFPMLCRECKPFDGVKRVLEGLAIYFPKIGICSYGKRKDIECLLRNHDLGRFFQAIVGFEDLTDKDENGVPLGKPHPQCLQLALQRLGSVPEKTAYVGDAQIDYEVGKRVGVRLVGLCTYGRFEREGDLRALGADMYFENPEKLLQLGEFRARSVD
jgi:phosphoglycolate phosphatase-like HAD superfamily hydrolase